MECPPPPPGCFQGVSTPCAHVYSIFRLFETPIPLLAGPPAWFSWGPLRFRGFPPSRANLCPPQRSQLGQPHSASLQSLQSRQSLQALQSSNTLQMQSLPVLSALPQMVSKATNVFIGGVPTSLSSEDVREEFSAFGKVSFIFLFFDYSFSS